MSQHPTHHRENHRIAVLGALALGFALLLVSCKAAVDQSEPAELIEKGWQKFRLDEQGSAAHFFTSALAKLADARSKSPETPTEKRLHIQATYGLGMVWSLGRHGEDSAKARGLFAEVIALEPKGEMAPWAALAIVRDEHLPVKSTDPIDRTALREKYQKVLTGYPGTPAAEEAFAFRQSLFLQTLTTEDARTSLAEMTAYLKDHPDTRCQSALYGLISQANRTLHDNPAALAASIKALETKEVDPSNPNMNNIVEYYSIGLTAEYDVGDFATARVYFNKFLDEYPTDQRAFNVRRELERMKMIEAAHGDTTVAGELGMRPAGGPGGLPEGSVLTTAPASAPESHKGGQ